MSPAHPLDPLTPDEIKAAVSVAKSYQLFPEGRHRFITVTLKEPDKDDVKAGKTVPREAYLEILDNRRLVTIESVVALETGGVVSWDELTGVQPQLTPDECLEAEQVVLKDAGVAEKLKELFGVTNMAHIRADPWSIGNMGRREEQGKRLLQTFLYYLNPEEDDNQYAHPIEGVVPVVDLQDMTMFKIEVYPELIMPIPKTNMPYFAEHIGEANMRQDIKPVEITQPEGPSYTIEGNKVSWQKWSFRVDFNSREGLVLRTLAYNDKGRDRPIMYRASLAEMVVPYGDSRAPHNRKIAFDVSEYGIGNCVNSLLLGCDCKGTIHYFDGVMNDSRGEPWIVPNAVCLHEEDHGILWKHTEYRTGHVEVRRSRRLVLSSVSTVVNYEYGLFWYLYQDGKIEFEIKHTGFLNTSGWQPHSGNGTDEQGGPLQGTMVMPGVNAQYHQHFYSMRLDMDVDGRPNRVYELNTYPAAEKEAAVTPGDRYRHNGLSLHASLLEGESGACRVADITSFTPTCWKVAHASNKNGMGYETAYKLLPGPSNKPVATEQSSVLQRAAFPSKTLWVTPYDPKEMHPAGNYPNQSLKGGGLPVWTAADRSLVDVDLVLWYSFGISHVPQAEDWPIMPVISTGFHLHPSNFFDFNPGHDVPPEKNKHTSCSNKTANATCNGTGH